MSEFSNEKRNQVPLPIAATRTDPAPPPPNIKQTSPPARVAHDANLATLGTAVLAIVTALLTCGVAAGAFYEQFNTKYRPLPDKVSYLETRLFDSEKEIAYLKDALSVVKSIDVRLARVENTAPADSMLIWIGTWSGKWNNTWLVKFEIFFSYKNNFIVAYSHQEQSDGPMVGPDLSAGVAEGDVLTWGNGYTIRRTSSHTAEAVSIFNNSGRGVKALLAKNK